MDELSLLRDLKLLPSKENIVYRVRRKLQQNTINNND